MLSPLRLCSLYVVAALAAAVAGAEGAADDAGLTLADEHQGQPGGAYTQQAGSHDVPDFLEVTRKLVTGSWKACKDNCDSDASCGGFKFTKAHEDHLPLCELLGDSTRLGSSQDEDPPQDSQVSAVYAHKKIQNAEQRARLAEEKKHRSEAIAHTAHMAMKRMANKVLRGEKKMAKMTQSYDDKNEQVLKEKTAFESEHAKVQALRKALQQQKHATQVVEKRLNSRSVAGNVNSRLDQMRLGDSVRVQKDETEVVKDQGKADQANQDVIKAEEKVKEEKEGGADKQSISKDEEKVESAKEVAGAADTAVADAESKEEDDKKKEKEDEEKTAAEAEQKEEDKVDNAKEKVEQAEKQLKTDEKKGQDQESVKAEVDADKAKVADAKASETNAEIEKTEVESEIKKDEQDNKAKDDAMDDEVTQANKEAQDQIKKVKTAEQNKEAALKEKVQTEEKVIEQQKVEIQKSREEMSLQSKLDAKKLETAKLKASILQVKLDNAGQDGVMVRRLEDQIKKDNAKLEHTKKTGANFEAMEKENKKLVKDSAGSTAKILESMKGTVLVKADQYAKMEAAYKLTQEEDQEKKKDRAANGGGNNLAVVNMKVVELEKQNTFLKSKIKQMVEDYGAAIKKAKEEAKKAKEKTAKSVEKARLQAEAHLAERKSTLLKLHKDLNKKRSDLETEIRTLKTTGKMQGERKSQLIEQYGELQQTQQHIQDQMVILENVAGKQKALRKVYDQRSKSILASQGSVFIKNSQMKASVAKYASNLEALENYLMRMKAVAGAKTPASVYGLMKKFENTKKNIVMRIAKHSSETAKDLIDEDLSANIAKIDGADSTKLSDMLNTMRAKKAELQAELSSAKRPSLNSVVRGEYKAVSESSDPAAVNRLLKRLDSQLATAQNATIAAKVQSDKDMARSVTRIYAHQIAHAKDAGYLQHKLKMLANWRARLAQQVENLKKSPNAPALSPNEEGAYNKVLNEVTNDPAAPKPSAASALMAQMMGGNSTNSTGSSSDNVVDTAAIKSHFSQESVVDTNIMQTAAVQKAMEKVAGEDMDAAVKTYFEIKRKRAMEEHSKQQQPVSDASVSDASVNKASTVAPSATAPTDPQTSGPSTPLESGKTTITTANAVKEIPSESLLGEATVFKMSHGVDDLFDLSNL